MKSLIVTVILLTQFGFSQAQVGFDGFGDIRIGKSYKELKKKITTVEEVPEYAWFSPLTIDFFMFEYGLDSTAALAMLEEFQEMDEEEMEDEPEDRTIMCSFKKKNDQTETIVESGENHKSEEKIKKSKKKDNSKTKKKKKSKE